MMLDQVSGISGKRDLDGDVWIVSECFHGIVEKLAMMTPEEANRRLSLTPPAGCRTLSFEIVGILHFCCHIKRIGSDIGCSRSRWNNGLFC